MYLSAVTVRGRFESCSERGKVFGTQSLDGDSIPKKIRRHAGPVSSSCIFLNEKQCRSTFNHYELCRNGKVRSRGIEEYVTHFVNRRFFFFLGFRPKGKSESVEPIWVQSAFAPVFVCPPAETISSVIRIEHLMICR